MLRNSQISVAPTRGSSVRNVVGSDVAFLAPGREWFPPPSRRPVHFVLLTMSSTGMPAVLPPALIGLSYSNSTSWRVTLSVTPAASVPVAGLASRTMTGS